MAADGPPAARRKPGPLTRVFRAWRVIGPEQRVCALAALSLWITMFLPWYSETGIAKNSAVSESLSAWGAFSFAELAVLLVSVAVLALLFARGERRAFHLPGGDGAVILVAGAWVGLLIFYRILDKPSAPAVITGIQWGIFLALFAAIWLAWTGLRIRRTHRAEPALADDPTVHLQNRPPARRERNDEPVAVPATVRSARPEDPPRHEDPEREHRGVTREDAEQLSFELPRDLRDS
jgi:hypothetical protein